MTWYGLDATAWTGIAFLMVGLVLIWLEIMMPGFFLAVPGGALAVGGALAIVFPDLMFKSSVAWILWPALLGAATMANMWAYRAMAPPSTKPITMVGDSLPGMEGEIENGQVRIRGQLWSCKTPSTLPAGTRVRVVKVEGNFLEVEPV